MRGRVVPWLGHLLSRGLGLAVLLTIASWTGPAAAQGKPTAGYPEPIVQWGVGKGETCDDIARALYGSAEHVGLLLRYNRIVCVRGAPLQKGLTLVLPAAVTQVPSARITTVNPQVKARPPGGAWSTAGAGQPLSTNSGVHTFESGRAGVQFIDRTRIYMASNTLVIIYGTASQTAVSKVPPPAVELQRGEVQAGLAALRGDTVDVAVAGGGRVNAASRDAVVARKGERTRVAVFDGKADVSSGGRRVSVPTNYGTDFLRGKAPKKPRPLPPAPAWAAGGSGLVVLAPAGQGRLEARWEAVPRAMAYRLEVSRDGAFQSLVVREEIPATARAFVGEQLPPGTYHLRVRAIDDEEYLGIASTRRTVEILAAEVTIGTGTVGSDRLQVNPYGVVALVPTDRLELALDDGPFGPLLPEIDVARMAPVKLRLRGRGSDVSQTVTLDYTPVTAELQVVPTADGGGLDVTAELQGLEGIDVAARVGPALRIHWPDGPATVPLAAQGDNRWGAMVPLGGAALGLRIDVVDRFGQQLGTTVTTVDSAAVPDQPSPAPLPVYRRLGPTLPMVSLSRHTNVVWFSPTAPMAAAATAGLGLDRDDELAVQGQAVASGALGPVGIEALLRTGSSPSGALADTNAWLGLRWRIHRFETANLELGPGLRASLPVAEVSPPAQLEPAFAVGATLERWSLLTNLGARARLHDPDGRSEVDPAQGFVLLGAGLEILPWLQTHALLDGHLFFGDALDATGGVSLGIEAGQTFFAGLGGRLSPRGDREGLFSAQLTLGIRQWDPSP